MCVEASHSLSADGKVKLVANPVKFSGTPIVDYKAPPIQGEHTEQILRELLGMEDTAVQNLRSKGIV